MTVRAIYRFISHTMKPHPSSDVTFEAECLRCDWKDLEANGSKVQDEAIMAHTGRTGHDSFRRIVTGFVLVVRNE